ncbi:MAG: YitT family protein [Ruminococcaceae bacterium]|nr:YitT family protein [Oscillospiraceae bacterium]
MQTFRKVQDYIVIIFAALLLAFSYHIFVYPNEFAPSGIPGIATMIQHTTGFSVGFLTFLVNIPLLLIVHRWVDSEYVIHTTVFAVVFSGFLVCLDHIDLSMLIYETDNSMILGPLTGGVISGFCYGIVMRRNGCTGGSDLIAAWIHHHKPQMNLLWVLFAFNAVVASVSYFVYDFKIEPVILCLMYCFISSKVSDMMLKGFKEAVKFEIVTEQPKELKMAIMETLHHGVTEISAVGGFTNQNKTLLICLVNKRQIVEFQKILEQFPGSFAYLSAVKETMGNFSRSK